MIRSCSRVTSPGGASGLTLIEVTISFAMFVVMVLAVSMTLVAGMRQRRATFEWYQAMRSARDMVAEIQHNANADQDLTVSLGVGATYVKYNAQTTVSTINKMIGETPTTECNSVAVAVYPDETSVMSKLGGAQDLNFDGDAADNLGNAGAGTDLKLVPMEVIVTYTEANQTRTLTVPRLVTKTTN